MISCKTAEKLPVLDGKTLQIVPSKKNIKRDEPHFETQLQIYWFGTNCFFLQFGKIGILTDPFVTNGSLFFPESDPLLVNETLGRLQIPDATFIEHSHFDHILDAHSALSLPLWGNVPLYGSQTTKNILAGYQTLKKQLHQVQQKKVFIPLSTEKKQYQLSYQAYKTQHPPHLKFGVTFLDGQVLEPLNQPPGFWDYQVGEVFNYLFEFKYNQGPQEICFRVLMLGCPPDPETFSESLPLKGTSIDVAILLTPPGTSTLEGYPKRHLEQLNPRVIILSHFNNFLAKNSEEVLSLAGFNFVNINQFLLNLQKATNYPEFERIIVPSLVKMDETGTARNVIHILPSKK